VREFLWFLFPLLGWGIRIAIHYVFGVRKLIENLKAKELVAEKIASEKLDVDSYQNEKDAFWANLVQFILIICIKNSYQFF
jgi:hypothetical protein